ncbi:MAG TPA: prolyl oligopeptidase family serine peptidase [Candidatus Angelobacter sp.]|jgi:pimeloyl-ACP methyl ester carboxylesterase|nr:prolyl oligopeptidase family serine peptidase [Candidatus Angelobacter sp.]
MFRTRFQKDIVAEFLPPSRSSSKQKIIILCDGMPSLPRKQPLAAFLADQGYWVFYPRYRGAWESGGQFLQHSPDEDILHVIGELPRGVTELAFGKRYRLMPDEIFVIGGSFGGAAALLASLDRRVKKVVANCPVIDWSVLAQEEKLETSNPSYPAYIRAAFGSGYRLSDRNWNKLRTGRFFNPASRIDELTPSKIMMFHALDDPYIPYGTVKQFAERTGIRLNSLRRGGHVKTEYVVRKYWATIRKFFATRI